MFIHFCQSYRENESGLLFETLGINSFYGLQSWLTKVSQHQRCAIDNCHSYCYCLPLIIFSIYCNPQYCLALSTGRPYPYLQPLSRFS